MADWKEYIWVLPIIGGIITLISLTVPVASYSYLTEWANLWMVGYWEGTSHLGKGLVNDIKVNINGNISATLAESATPFFLCFLGVVIGGIIALVAGGRGYRGKFSKRSTLISGILIIIFTLLFIGWMDSSYKIFSDPIILYEDPYGGLSLSFNIQFGIIGPFIGGAFCLTGGLIRTEVRIE